MQKKRPSQPAVMLRGYCDLTGKPCLPGIHLLQSMIQATQSIGDALPDDFFLEAVIDIDTCPRACQLALKAEGQTARIACGDNLLAEVLDDAMPSPAFRMSEHAGPALSRRAH